MNIIILSDGRPGHFNQSLGIVSALERITSLRTEIVPVRRPNVLARFLLPRMLNAGWERLVPMLARAAAPELPFQPDLIISAGGATLASNALLARRHGCRNIFSGSVRAYDPTLFSLVLHVFPDRAALPRHLVTLKPAPFPAEGLTPVVRPPQRFLLLVGGPIDRCALSNTEVVRMIEQLQRLRSQWSIATSRRTPPAWERIIRDWAAADKTVRLVVPEDGPGLVPDLIADADAVVVTADSSSMISEAVALQRPTVIMEGETGCRSVDRAYLDTLEADGRLKRLSAPAFTPETLLNALAEIVPLDRPAVDHLSALLANALDLPARPGTDGERLTPAVEA